MECQKQAVNQIMTNESHCGWCSVNPATSPLSIPDLGPVPGSSAHHTIFPHVRFTSTNCETRAVTFLKATIRSRFRPFFSLQSRLVFVELLAASQPEQRRSSAVGMDPTEQNRLFQPVVQYEKQVRQKEGRNVNCTLWVFEWGGQRGRW